MSAFSLLRHLNRLSLRSPPSLLKRDISTNVFLNFKATPCLFAEPLKKKKKMDPAVVRAREDRKKRKIEKQIRRLEKNARQLKPLEECDITVKILDEKKSRTRNLPALSVDELEKRALIEKKWANYKLQQHLADTQMLDRIIFAQQRALDELRKESEELYQEAMQIDFRLIPYKSEGPCVTPKIKDYEIPDGDYLDVSKKWE